MRGMQMSALLLAAGSIDQSAPWQVRATALTALLGAPASAVGGGLAGWVWLWVWLGASGIYGLVGALVMAALSASAPRPGAKQLMVEE